MSGRKRSFVFKIPAEEKRILRKRRGIKQAASGALPGKKGRTCSVYSWYLLPARISVSAIGRQVLCFAVVADKIPGAFDPSRHWSKATPILISRALFPAFSSASQNTWAGNENTDMGERFSKRSPCPFLRSRYEKNRKPVRLTAFILLLVPRGRLELPRHSALPPQDSVSTNSTTWAQLFLYSKGAGLASTFFIPAKF